MGRFTPETPSTRPGMSSLAAMFEGVAGVNLPMLVRALTYRNEPLATVVEKTLSGGTEGVLNMPAPYHNAATGS